MRAKDPRKESINPRNIAKTSSAALAEYLIAVGYVPQMELLNDLGLAFRRGLPLMMGGHRGVGKTRAAEAVAEAFNLDLFVVNGHEGTEARDIVGGWDRLAQAEAVREALSAGRPLEEARAGKWQMEFYESGEFLDAYKEADRATACGDPPPVLLIDEVEKLPLKLQHTILQPLARGWMDIPKLSGRIGVTERDERPFVMLTSNDLKALSEPLLSRCVVTWMEPPTPEEEVRILRAQQPDASPEQVAAVAGIINYIREDMPEINDKPGVRESIEFLGALVEDRVGHITAAMIHQYIACLGKGKSERVLLKEGAESLAWAAQNPGTEICAWVAEAFNLSDLVAMNAELEVAV